MFGQTFEPNMYFASPNECENDFEIFVNQLNERAQEACRCFLWFVIKQFLDV